MLRKVGIAVLIMFFALVGWPGGVAQAAPINRVEPPDLGNAALGALDVGVNTVSGSIACSLSFCVLGDSLDDFSFSLAAGLKITSITITVSNFDGVNNFGLARDQDSFAPITVDEENLANGPFNLFSGAASGPGILTFQTIGGCVNPEESCETSFDYIWSFTVARVVTVPEPATLLLLASAAGGIGAVRLWRRR